MASNIPCEKGHDLYRFTSQFLQKLHFLVFDIILPIFCNATFPTPFIIFKSFEHQKIQKIQDIIVFI